MAIDDGERKALLGTNQKKAVRPDHVVTLNGEKIAPPWLTPLLRARFFSSCSDHRGNKNECNLYCLDCAGDALCPRCLPRHRDHRVLQIRRSSYQSVIKASEASEYVDITGVQTYVINSAKVVFLNERPQVRPGKDAAHACGSCCRPLIGSHLFCSIACKLGGLRQGQGVNIALSEETQRSGVLQWPESGDMPQSAKRPAVEVSVNDDGKENSNGRSAAENSTDGVSQAERPVSSHRRSRRKGIPCRASFW